MAKNGKQATTAAIVLMTLGELVGFGEAGTKAQPSAVQSLVDAGHAEVNPAGPDANGLVDVRATKAGIAAVSAPEATAATDTTTAAASTEAKPAKAEFEILSNFVPPQRKGRGRSGATKYPFEKLEVGNAFFVPGKDAAKSLASTVSSATKRYATEVKDEAGNVVMVTNRKGRSVPKLNVVRKFEIYSGKNAAGVDGAFVTRTEVKAGATVEAES